MSEQILEPASPAVAPRAALEFLSRAGTVLAASLDYEQTLRTVVNLAVPDIADWCAMFLLEDDGAEREITSVHPDQEIEAAIMEIRRRRRDSAASESVQVARSGTSVLVSHAGLAVSDPVSAEERRALERLQARSYMIVPLLARGRMIGAMTLLSTREGRHYTAADLAFVETLAVRCALAIDTTRLYDAAERSLGLLDTLFATAPVGLAFVDRDLRYVRINEALATMHGKTVAEHLGRTVAEVLGPRGEEIAEALAAVASTGEPVLEREVSGASPARPGEAHHWVSSYTPVRGGDGEILGVGITVTDVTERRALLDAERDARRRADFLAEAGSILESSLDYEETLANVAQIAVPGIADWCAVSVLDEAGELREVAAAHSDPVKRALGAELSARFPPDPATSGTHVVARSGVTQVVRDVTDEMLVAGLADPERLDLVRRLGLRSVIIAPLNARGRTFGTLTLVNAESGRLFDEPDVQLAEELARRAAVAIDNARLYTERTRIAHTLQAKLLPERLPEIPGALVAARYRAAGELNEVGGDFYDVFPRSGSDWALVIGDVSGKGAEAAAVTALARYTLRAATLEAGPPSQALATLNTAMLADGSSQFATVVLGYASAGPDGSLVIEMALGGHPPPLVLRADGRIDSLDGYGTVLGVLAQARFIDSRLELGAGDVMLLYTDGVTEAGSRTDPFAETGLRELLGTLAGAPPQVIVERVEQAVVDAQLGEPRDDIALLALGVMAA